MTTYVIESCGLIVTGKSQDGQGIPVCELPAHVRKLKTWRADEIPLRWLLQKGRHVYDANEYTLPHAVKEAA